MFQARIQHTHHDSDGKYQFYLVQSTKYEPSDSQAKRERNTRSTKFQPGFHETDGSHKAYPNKDGCYR